ncbi:class I SAM-dependent methyltransferase [Spirosoma utsteinense]|uniref:2-polyprenyl-3-methyl-5-hydroxy-6-metoxy-1, 4-benzoquinol methylase n=1 Tax=Spirosoma utsteinense TaxID=2585773 RepID=A0ABR6WDY5_9BACT|nr:methyltransferase domain-containing protein [Spirosoma utsteinense]MBC3788957.1 2-polyprenyl-3-methyl-5-hydroxy-6-metoxy-1,4-benzoquinol methylase [Spirosoma utsteinense]MBC3794383.1 2-polyprenyl-3-methyl-5-hydroxy-6-metoxy-1,4-benzoquinol methylase [Spirosoma utsteinense]
MTATWLDFWQKENEFDDSMSANYAYFLARVEQFIPLSMARTVLDIGSGPGNLEDAWHNRVAEIHGLDISERYNAIARAKHAHHPNVHFHTLSADDYLNFSPVAGQQFDIIVVMSVVQYYRNAAEVETLLAAIKKVAAPGAKALICDLIVEESMLKDILSIMGRSLRQGQLLSMLKLLFRLRFSSYYEVRKKNGFLIIPEAVWMGMCKRLGLNARFVTEPLTMQQERRNLLIQF